MPYGILKVDTITFTNNSVDKSVSLSGLIQNPTFTGNVTATGTISGAIITAPTGVFTTLSGTTTTGTTANFASGVFTTQVSGARIIAPTGTFTTLTGTTTTGTTANFVSGVFSTLLTANSLVLNNTNISTIKVASFNSQLALGSTAGSITIDWGTAQNQRQPEPTGTITYTFINPPGPCHLQLLIDSDGTSTAQTLNWPGTVIYLGATFAGANNKRAVINFWFDGTNYFAIGTNQA